MHGTPERSRSARRVVCSGRIRVRVRAGVRVSERPDNQTPDRARRWAGGTCWERPGRKWKSGIRVRVGVSVKVRVRVSVGVRVRVRVRVGVRVRVRVGVRVWLGLGLGLC